MELYKSILKLREQLQIAFPKCFFSINHEKPLKRGIYHDLLQKANTLSPIPNKKLISLFLYIYTSSISYRAACIVSDAKRIDLAGNEIEVVSADDRLSAKIRSPEIRFALDEGYERDTISAKAKRKEELKILQQQKLKASQPSTEQSPGMPFNTETKAIIDNKPSLNVLEAKKPVTVTIKKRRNIKPTNESDLI